MPNHPAVMPQGEIREIFPDIFWLQGTVRMAPGMVINRVMTVLRHEGELTVVNAIRPADPSALDALGKVAHVLKIGSHGMDDAWYAEHYGATRWAVEGAPGADRVLRPGDSPIPWLEVFAFKHTNSPELALLAHRNGGVLITCDSVQNWPDTAQCSLIARAASAAMGFTSRPAQIGPPWRKMQTPKSGSLEPDFRRILDLPFEHLVGGHGAPLFGGAKAALAATVESTF